MVDMEIMWISRDHVISLSTANATESLSNNHFIILWIKQASFPSGWHIAFWTASLERKWNPQATFPVLLSRQCLCSKEEDQDIN